MARCTIVPLCEVKCERCRPSQVSATKKKKLIQRLVGAGWCRTYHVARVFVLERSPFFFRAHVMTSSSRFHSLVGRGTDRGRELSPQVQKEKRKGRIELRTARKSTQTPLEHNVVGEVLAEQHHGVGIPLLQLINGGSTFFSGHSHVLAVRISPCPSGRTLHANHRAVRNRREQP